VAQDASQEVLKNLKADGDISIGNVDVKIGATTIVVAPITASLKSDYRFPPKIEGAWVVREAFQTQLAKWVTARVPMCGLWALSGFGKSWLAAWAFQAFRAQFGVAQWIRFVGNDLISFQQFGRFVLQELGRSVDEKLSNAELRGALVAELGRHDCLLVLDQVEAIETGAEWEEFSEFWREWGEYGQRSMVLVTTRRQFDRSGMQWLPVTGLNEGEGRAFLAQYEGIRSGEGIGDLVAAASGHPYMLRFAGSWLVQAKGHQPTVGVEDVRLFRSLFGDQTLDLTQKVEVVFEQLFAALPKFLQEMLSKVTVYRGDLGLAAAQGMVAEVTIKDLRQLQEKGFLVAVQDDRFILHPLVEGFIRSCLSDADRVVAHEAAIGYFKANIKQVSAERCLEDCREELEIFYHACEIRDYDKAYLIYCTINSFLNKRGFYQEQIQLLGQLVTQFSANSDNAEDRGSCFLWLGGAYTILGQYQRALDFQQQCLEIACEINDQVLKAQSLGSLGDTCILSGQCQRGIDFHQQCLEIACEIDDQELKAASLMSLGDAYKFSYQYQRGIDFYQQGLEIARKIDNQALKAASITSLGDVYRILEQYRLAIDLLQQGLEIGSKIGNRRVEATSFCALGYAYQGLDQCQNAIDHLQQSLEISHEIGDRRGEASSFAGLGIAYRSLGQYQHAIDCLQQSLEISHEIGDFNLEASSFAALGVAYRSLGQYQRAIESHLKSLEIGSKIGNRMIELGSFAMLGRDYQKMGQYQRSIEFHLQSLEISHEIGSRSTEAISLANLGYAYASLGQYQRSIEFHQQSLEIERKIGNCGGEASSLLSLANLYQQCGRPKRAMYYRHQVYRIWQEMQLPVESTPFPDFIKRMMAKIGDGWVEQLIASERMIASFMIPIIYLAFTIRTLLSPLTFLQKKLKIKPLWFWLGVLIVVLILIYWLNR
jgi:tetratricopeptide (TPR) repeat protein